MIEQPKRSDYLELLAFEERVFCVPFCQKVPKLYLDPDVCVQTHRVIRENGKIVAAIAAWPGMLLTPGGSLKTIGIGSVAVDDGCRGKGYMREMMLCCDEIARQQGAAFGFLGGYRQRYGYYGYAPGGVRYEFDVTGYFIARAKPQTAYTFTPLAQDTDALPAVYRLFAAQDARWQRSEADFLCTASMWHGCAYTVRSEAGGICGYLITEQAPEDIGELVLASGTGAADVLIQFARYKGCDRLHVNLQPGQTALRRQLGDFAECPRVTPPATFKIYDYKRMIEVLGSWKAQFSALPEGTVVLDLAGTRLRVTLRGGVCTAAPTTESADLSFTAHEAVTALTTPCAPPTKNALFNAWAPLCPVFLPHCDSV